MPRVGPTTTIKVSRRVMQFIEEHAGGDESVDGTLRRLLKLEHNGQLKPPAPIPMTTTIKVSKSVMKFIRKKAKVKESRDMTLGRLLGVAPEDGNLPKPASTAEGINRKSMSVRPDDGNVQLKA